MSCVGLTNLRVQLLSYQSYPEDRAAQVRGQGRNKSTNFTQNTDVNFVLPLFTNMEGHIPFLMLAIFSITICKFTSSNPAVPKLFPCHDHPTVTNARNELTSLVHREQVCTNTTGKFRPIHKPDVFAPN